MSSIDIFYSKNYFEYDEDWRNSIFCTFLGIFATFACLLSNFSLLVLTFEKFLIVSFIYQVKFLNFSIIILITSLITSLSIMLSILPIFFYQVKDNN